MLKNPSISNAKWGTGSNFNSTSNTAATMPYMIYMSDSGIVLQLKDIKIIDGENPTIASINSAYNYKIVLMKV